MANTVLKRSEAATLLWEEWKYRHELFWRSLYRWGLAAVSVSVVPWVNPDLIPKLQRTILIFPVLASGIALFAAWHLGSEYSRLLKVSATYKRVLGEFCPEPITHNPKFVVFFFKWPIGWVVPLGFVAIAVPISAVNGLLLLAQLSSGRGGSF